LDAGLLTALGALLVALLTVAGIVGTWAALRVGRNAQTISNYRDAISSWKERSEAQDQELTEVRTQLDKLKSENAELRGQINTLRDAISGRSVFDGLSEALAKQHRELLDRIDKLAEGR
jgi:cell division protein FtsB